MLQNVKKTFFCQNPFHLCDHVQSLFTSFHRVKRRLCDGKLYEDSSYHEHKHLSVEDITDNSMPTDWIDSENEEEAVRESES